MPTLTIKDETLGGESFEALKLEILTERVTVREMIRARIYQEVQDYNVRQPEVFFGLVQPTDFEQALNGFRPGGDVSTRRMIRWERQFEKALEAFRRHQILVLIDDEQVESLDQEFVVSPRTQVTFLRLVPLVGG